MWALPPAADMKCPVKGTASGESTPLFVPAPQPAGGLFTDGSKTPVLPPNLLQHGQGAVAPQDLMRKLEEVQLAKALPQHGAVAPPPQKGNQKMWQVSVGTVGHPFSCSAACPWPIGDCPEGSRCKFCHECSLEIRHQPLPEAVPEPVPEPLHMPMTILSEKEPSQGAEATLARLMSIGSLGHPHTCANACKYVKRKQGCRNGAACEDCHLCHWQRKPVPKPPMVLTRMPAGAALAANSLHPQQLLLHDALPQGFAEPLPLCAPCAEPLPAMPLAPPPGLAPPASTGAEPLGASLSQAAPSLSSPPIAPSVGSIGHPFTCGRACKYTGKPRGCKDGKFCVCCHLCQWRRHQPAPPVMPF